MTVQYKSSYCKKKKSVQQQCNICPLIVEDHLFLFIILDALYVYGKKIF